MPQRRSATKAAHVVGVVHTCHVPQRLEHTRAVVREVEVGEGVGRCGEAAAGNGVQAGFSQALLQQRQQPSLPGPWCRCLDSLPILPPNPATACPHFNQPLPYPLQRSPAGRVMSVNCMQCARVTAGLCIYALPTYSALQPLPHCNQPPTHPLRRLPAGRGHVCRVHACKVLLL